MWLGFGQFQRKRELRGSGQCGLVAARIGLGRFARGFLRSCLRGGRLRLGIGKLPRRRQQLVAGGGDLPPPLIGDPGRRQRG